MLYGPHSRIASEELPLDRQAEEWFRFRSRGPQDVDKDRKKVQEELMAFGTGKNLEFRLVSGHVDPETGVKLLGPRCGLTDFTYYRPATIYISFETLTPLLNKTITPAERLLCHFKFGTTVAHEFIVCFSTNFHLSAR